jgi:m7GpppX diphosphatase
MGMSVGQAHLLEDVISLVGFDNMTAISRFSKFPQLELDEANPGTPGIFEKMTLTYGLGEQHGLYVAMKAAEAEG